MRALPCGALEPDGLLEAEGQVGFGWYVELLATGKSLGSSAGGPAREGSDGRTFSAACEGTDERAGCCASADVLAGALVFTDTFFLIGGCDILAFHRIANAVDPYCAKINGQAVGIMDRGELGGRTFWNKNVAVAAKDVFAHGAAIHVGCVGILDIRVDGIIGSNGDFGSAGDGVALC